MSAGGYLDACGFAATSTGTGNFVVASALTGYQTPASAGAVNATVYSYRAESADKTQWEEGFGAYTVSGTTQARTTITANSSGGTTAISFATIPNVYITALSQDLQNASLLTNGAIPIGRLPSAPTIQKFLSGSGTYTTPAGCRWLRVRLVGGGAGGAGSGSGLGLGAAGGATTFGTSLLTGGGGGQAASSSISAGGTATGGDTNVPGGGGSGGNTLANSPGPGGGNSYFGGGGAGGGQNGAGGAAATNSGSGGGGAGMASVAAAGSGGGAAGGYVEKIITSPLATYAYVVGAGGSAGTAGTSGTAGGAGAAGQIIVEEYYL